MWVCALPIVYTFKSPFIYFFVEIAKHLEIYYKNNKKNNFELNEKRKKQNKNKNV